MNNLSFQKFKKELTERRYGGPVKGVEYRKLSPTLKVAVNDVYSMIDKASDPIVGKIEGIIKMAAKKHNVKVSAIEDYFDNELIK
jgi:hypothetical protein|tara:strand:- start:139 stop:393 length:255 start_codon:yes stop_codon:yes gene_type:complete